MITGLPFQIALAVLSLGSIASVCLYRRGWWRAPEGQYLVIFTGITALWWSLVGVGTVLMAATGTYPPWLQAAQGFALILMAAGVLWCIALQIRSRRRTHTNERAAQHK